MTAAVDTSIKANHMQRKTRRTGVAITLGLCCLCTLGALAFANLLFGFWIPAPSNATIEYAIRNGPGDGTAGVGEDGLDYETTAVTRPHRTGVADPKQWTWLRVRNGDTLIGQGLLRIALVDGGRRVVLLSFVPDTSITERFLNQNFTPAQQTQIDALRSP